MKMQINCDNCDVSKYGGYFEGAIEFCLKYNKDLKRDTKTDTTIPCIECNGHDFTPDTWDS